MSAPTPKLGETGSLVDRLVVLIRDAIIAGEFAPGEHIRIKPLADSHGVSLIPVREALSRLLSTRIVIAEPNRGYFVAPAPTDETFCQFRLFRELFEVSAVELGFDNVTEADITRLTNLNGKMRSIAEGRPGKKQLVNWGHLNGAFHEVLVGLARNPFIMQQQVELSFVHMYFQIARSETVDFGILKTLATEHDGLIEALKSRDKDTLLQRLSSHINRTV